MKLKKTIYLISGLVIAVGLIAGVAKAAAYNKWSWLKGTYWIVPPTGIYSVYHIERDNSFVVTRGQTVFSITDYFNGYFTGSVVVKITETQVTSCQFVLGQVTPEGKVFMTMYNATTGAVNNYPIGNMVLKDDQWTMVNQMTSPAQGGTISHWAYMVQSKQGDASYEHLPFVNESIPNFLSSCPPGPMISNPLNLTP
ncbi:MAG: hypothetical protein FGM35_05090 [Rhodocyclaceae bacterium]|jgi:hypothetical protein|nr:hypothetical protein [Rhodocyclaceae bacterium]